MTVGTVALSSPTVLKRWIVLELRKLRENSGVTRAQVAERLQCALSHVSHLENGRNLPKAAELRDLLTFYGVDDRTEFFLELLAAAKKGRDWWTDYADAVPEWFDLFLGLESSAVQLESYDALTIPGILQTGDYAEAVIRGGEPELGSAAVTGRIQLRLARQAILDREDPPHVWSVLDESALRRPAGKPGVMRDQLEHLLTLSSRPNVEIQVLPLATGPHAGLHGTFIFLSFPAELVGESTVAYTETPVRGIYHDHPDELRQFRRTLTRVQIQAASPEESRDILARTVRELEQ